MFDYEYGQADYNLEEVKEKLLQYLISSYYVNNENAEEAGRKTFKYLESVVNTIIKRKDVKIQFGSGGSPLWHSTILSYLSKWVEAEFKTGKLLSSELDSHLPE